MLLQLFHLGMSCGTVEENGQVAEVVAAGGALYGWYSNAVFIYNIDSGEWRSGIALLVKLAVVLPLFNYHPLTGTNFPKLIGYGATVPYRGTFLIIGGAECNTCRCSGGCLNRGNTTTIIKYTEDGEWETLPMLLALGRWEHTVITKPAC